MDRLRTLGLKVNDIVLDRPWDEPFSRRSLVVPAAWFSRAGDVVRADSLAKDLPILQRVMSRAYGGWETATSRGWDWQKWFNDWQAMLARHGDKALPVGEAFAPLKELMAFQLDNHTNIPLHPSTRFGSGSQTAILASEPKKACSELEMKDGARIAMNAKDPAQRVKKAQQWDGKVLKPVHYIALPQKKGEPRKIHCGEQWIDVKPAWRRPEVDAEPNLESLTPKVAYLRLPTFHKRNSQLIEERMPKWPKPTAEKVLIVDMRGNEGGDAAIDALSGWVEDARIEDAIKRGLYGHRHEGASCLYDALRWGYVVASSQGLKPPLSPGLLKDFQDSIDVLAKPADAGCPAAFKDTRSGWDYRKHHMGSSDGRRRIIAVVDDACGSDCEAMALILAALPETVIVGTNTFGVAQYIQPGYSVLPHSRLPYRIALGTSDNYGDDRSFDGYGLDVDVVLADEQAHSRASLVALAEQLTAEKPRR